MSRLVAFQQIPYKFIAGEKVESERDHQCKGPRKESGEKRDKKKAAKIYLGFARSLAYYGSICTQRSKGASQTRKFKRAQRDI
jgi:hypothetical protein